jgi:hypothetical protein
MILDGVSMKFAVDMVIISQLLPRSTILISLTERRLTLHESQRLAIFSGSLSSCLPIGIVHLLEPRKVRR